MLISDECPALCGTCIPPVCNGKPDPEICDQIHITEDKCGDTVFNQSITDNCPVLCGTCIDSTTTTTITTTTFTNTTTTASTTTTTTNYTNYTGLDEPSANDNGEVLGLYATILLILLLLVLLLVGIAYIVRHRKEPKEKVELPAPSTFSVFNPPSYRTSTAARRRVKSKKSAWVPPKAPEYRAPPPYPGTYMPPPVVTDPRTGEQLPLYKPCPPYIQAVLIRARQTAQSWGEKKDRGGGDGASSVGSPGSMYDAPPKFDGRSGGSASKSGRRSRSRSGLQRAAPSYQAAPSFGKGAPYRPKSAGSAGRSPGRTMRPAPAYEEPPSHASVFDDDAAWSNDRSSTASSHYGEDDTRA